MVSRYCFSRAPLPPPLRQLILLWDVASRTFLRNSTRSSAILPASVVVVPSQSVMSCSHLLDGLPLRRFPSTFVSKMCFSSESWRLMCPKYFNFRSLTFCKSVGDGMQILFSTSSFDIFSVQEIFKNFSVTL